MSTVFKKSNITNCHYDSFKASHEILAIVSTNFEYGSCNSQLFNFVHFTTEHIIEKFIHNCSILLPMILITAELNTIQNMPYY